tara:strand:+ start:214 stop:645 length:432 start_codon:yes stop_codon:yes gene_type:complete
MSIQSVSGLQVYMGTNAASTQAEFEALTMVNIHYVESVSDFGDSFNPIIFQGMEGRSKHLKGSVDAGDFVLRFGLCSTCVGQFYLILFALQTFPRPFKIVFSGGEIRYFMGHIYGIKESLPNADNILMIDCSIGIAGPIIQDN